MVLALVVPTPLARLQPRTLPDRLWLGTQRSTALPVGWPPRNIHSPRGHSAQASWPVLPAAAPPSLATPPHSEFVRPAAQEHWARPNSKASPNKLGAVPHKGPPTQVERAILVYAVCAPTQMDRLTAENQGWTHRASDS